MPLNTTTMRPAVPGTGKSNPRCWTFIKATDGTLVAKYLAKNFAYQAGKTLSFMPKPLYGEAGNGMHVHQLLMKGNTNIFYDPEGYRPVKCKCALLYWRNLIPFAGALCAYKSLYKFLQAPDARI